MRKHLLRLCALSAITAITLNSCVSGSKGEEEDYDTIKVGHNVPQFEVSDRAGVKFESPSGFDNKTTLLVFFKVDCPYCRNELPKVQYIADDIAADTDAQVINIVVDNPSGIADYWQEKGYTMNYYLDSGRAVFYKFAEQYVPRLYIIGGDGTVKWMYVGETDMNKAQLLSKFNSYR